MPAWLNMPGDAQELPATLPGQSVLNRVRDAQSKGQQQLLKG